MKNTDDGTLSLFGDELPPAPATPTKAAKPPAEKKPRAKRKPKEVAPEVANDAGAVKEEVVEKEIEKAVDASATSTTENQAAPKPVQDPVLGQPNPLVLRAAVEPQQRRNSPWAAVVQAKADLQKAVAEATTFPKVSTPTETTSTSESQPHNNHKPHVMMVITKGEAG
ncbi:MAG: hypothetical protein ACOVNN_00370, partial [Limnohabitans sp.]